MNSHQQHQQQRVSELRMRRWAGRTGQHQPGASGSVSGSDELELSLRSGSFNTSFSTSETVCCETPASSTRSGTGGGAESVISSEFEFCRPSSSRSRNSSRAASPLLCNSPCPASPNRTPGSRTPRSPRSPTPHSPSSASSPQPGAGYNSSRRRSGAVTGNLARLASRRSSRDSEAGEPSPLQCSRMNQRRTSNFLEIPGKLRRFRRIILFFFCVCG